MEGGLFQNRWIFRDVSRGGGSHFLIKNLSFFELRIYLTTKRCQNTAEIGKIFSCKLGWGSKAVWNFCENSYVCNTHSLPLVLKAFASLTFSQRPISKAGIMVLRIENFEYNLGVFAGLQSLRGPIRGVGVAVEGKPVHPKAARPAQPVPGSYASMEAVWGKIPVSTYLKDSRVGLELPGQLKKIF